jgi:hypothetical protein
MVLALRVQDGWVSSGAWTALGTILLAAVTLAAVLTTIVITAQDRRGAAARLASERAHSDKQMADERARWAASTSAQTDCRCGSR